MSTGQSVSQPETQSDVRPALPPAVRARLYLYLLPLALTPLLVILLACVVVPTDWFIRHSDNVLLANTGYGSTLHHADCEVLVYGDSAAMFGVDPEVIHRQTGLTTCNIAEIESVNMVYGTEVVDDYLRRNSRPRAIVFLFAPEDFNPQSRHGVIPTFEGVTYVMRQPHKLAHFLQLMREPKNIFIWSEAGMRIAALRLAASGFPAEAMHLRDAHGGQLPRPATQLKACTYVPINSMPPDRDWVNGLRSKYGAGGTLVLVDSMPMPTCDPRFAYFQQQLSGVSDLPVQMLPVSDYLDEGPQHANAAGSVVLGTMIAKQISDGLDSGQHKGAP